MLESTRSVVDSASEEIVPPPRRQHHDQPLQLNAVQVIHILGLLPLAMSVVGVEPVSPRRLPAAPHRRGHPLVSSDATVLLIALLARLWQRSSREVGLWLSQWPAHATACGLPAHRVIAPRHFTRRIKKLGADPFWLLSRALAWRGLRAGLLTGRDVVIDSSVLAAWSTGDPDADWSFPSSFHGYVFGYKVHVLLDRAARLPLGVPFGPLLSPANKNALPFADPVL